MTCPHSLVVGVRKRHDRSSIQSSKHQVPMTSSVVAKKPVADPASCATTAGGRREELLEPGDLEVVCIDDQRTAWEEILNVRPGFESVHPDYAGPGSMRQQRDFGPYSTVVT